MIRRRPTTAPMTLASSLPSASATLALILAVGISAVAAKASAEPSSTVAATNGEATAGGAASSSSSSLLRREEEGREEEGTTVVVVESDDAVDRYDENVGERSRLRRPETTEILHHRSSRRRLNLVSSPPSTSETRRSAVLTDVPNFSYAGYGGDALNLPPHTSSVPPGSTVVDVTDPEHGAVPNDDGDDAAAVLSAVNAAKNALLSGSGGVAAVVVYFPAGEYRIEGHLTFDLTGENGGGIIFKGETDAVGGTPLSTLHFPFRSENDTPWVQYRGGPFVQIKGNGYTGPSGGPADVLEGASMNEFSIVVSGQPSWATPGTLVRLKRTVDGANGQDALLDYRGRPISSGWTKFGNDGRGPSEFHSVTSVAVLGSGHARLTFREPFKTDVALESSEQMGEREIKWTVEPWKGVAQNVGVEDLVFRGSFRRDSSANCRFHDDPSFSGSMVSNPGWADTWVNGVGDAELWCDKGPAGGRRCDREFVHHCNYVHDTGHSALSLFRAADSYVRNVVFTDVTNALSLSSAFATTVLDVTVTSTVPLGETEPQMHTSVRIESGTDNFFGRIVMEVSSDHGLGLAGVSSGNVFWKCTWPSITGPELHGKGLATSNLFDDCSGGMSSLKGAGQGKMVPLGIGGAKADLPHHGKGLWFWNQEVKLPSGLGGQAYDNDLGSLDRGDHFWADDLNSYGPFVHGVNFVGRHPGTEVGGGGLHRGQIGLDDTFGKALSGMESSLYDAQRRLRDPPSGGGWVLHPGRKCAVSRSAEETGGWHATNTLSEATAACSADPLCGAVYDYKCDGNGFVLCGRDRGDGNGATGDVTDAPFLVLEDAPAGTGGCTYRNPRTARVVYEMRSDKKCVRNRPYGTPGGLDYASLKSPRQAFEACDADPTCGGVYDYKCDGMGYMLCDVDGSGGGTSTGNGLPTLEAAPAAGGCTYLHPHRRYAKYEGTRCGSPRPYGTEGGYDYSSLKALRDALDKCDEDSGCGAVYDYKCDGNGYMLCDRDGPAEEGLATSTLAPPPSLGGCTHRREYS